MVYPGESFEPAATLQTVEAEKCDVLYGVPTMFIAQLNQPDFAKYNLSSLRRGIMAGAPCPVEVMKEVMSKMHMGEITIAYGMTETSPVSFQSSRDDPIELRVSTVGRVQPHLDVKIIDTDGRVVPRGEPGELCTRGYSVMLGYWGDEVRTKEAIDSDGWMHTGDLATIDEDGYCRIVGRIKDMVIRGGENIYPREVEEFLHRHPDVQDVQVIGVPDERYGEELCAWIVPRAGAMLDEESIRNFCRDQIAHYKVPRYVRLVEGFPTTVTGKVQKFEMRKQMVKELGLPSPPAQAPSHVGHTHMSSAPNLSSQTTELLVFLPLKPGARERFQRMLFEVAEHIAKEPDFVSASVYEDMDDPDTIVLYESWVGSREHLLKTQLSKTYRKEYEAALPQLLKAERRFVFLKPPLVRYSKA
jgi:quinol monooxygenase YgiN